VLWQISPPFLLHLPFTTIKDLFSPNVSSSGYDLPQSPTIEAPLRDISHVALLAPRFFVFISSLSFSGREAIYFHFSAFSFSSSSCIGPSVSFSFTSPKHFSFLLPLPFFPLNESFEFFSVLSAAEYGFSHSGPKSPLLSPLNLP